MIDLFYSANWNVCRYVTLVGKYVSRRGGKFMGAGVSQRRSSSWVLKPFQLALEIFYKGSVGGLCLLVEVITDQSQVMLCLCWDFLPQLLPVWVFGTLFLACILFRTFFEWLFNVSKEHFHVVYEYFWFDMYLFCPQSK